LPKINSRQVMVNTGQLTTMSSSNTIASIRFKHPQDARMGIELVAVSELRQRASAAHFSKPQRADFYHLIGVTSGHTNPMVDFTPHACGAGHCLLVRPGQVMRYDFSLPWEGWLLAFRPESLPGSGRRAGPGELTLELRIEQLLNHWELSTDQCDTLGQALQLMHGDAKLPMAMDARNALLQHQLSAVLLRLSIWQEAAPSAAAAPAAHSHFRRFRHLLETEFTRSHQVQYYASQLAMGEKSLGRACLAGAGVSAKVCIAQRIVLEAKRLLAHTSLPVQTIALDLGFDDPTNFVKFFRKECGETPGGFRRQQAA
jgi:AraC-like DNA-binding protein